MRKSGILGNWLALLWVRVIVLGDGVYLVWVFDFVIRFLGCLFKFFIYLVFCSIKEVTEGLEFRRGFDWLGVGV